MNAQKLIFLLVGVALGFVAGFWLANGVNRGEQDKLRAEVTRLRAEAAKNEEARGAQGAQTADGQNIPTLTEEELRRGVERADANPSDTQLQQMTGQALYVYAREKGNAAILPDVIRRLGAQPRHLRAELVLLAAVDAVRQPEPRDEPERDADQSEDDLLCVHER